MFETGTNGKCNCFTTEDVIALESDGVTKRAESEKWLDDFQSEVEDITDSIEEY